MTNREFANEINFSLTGAKKITPLLGGVRMEYVLTGLVVAAFAVIGYQQPVVYETLFPWLAASSALLIFALLFTKLSAYIDPTKLPHMFVATIEQHASIDVDTLHYGIGTAIGMSLILGLLLWKWSCKPGEWAHDDYSTCSFFTGGLLEPQHDSMPPTKSGSGAGETRLRRTLSLMEACPIGMLDQGQPYYGNAKIFRKNSRRDLRGISESTTRPADPARSHRAHGDSSSRVAPA